MSSSSVASRTAHVHRFVRGGDQIPLAVVERLSHEDLLSALNAGDVILRDKSLAGAPVDDVQRRILSDNPNVLGLAAPDVRPAGGRV
jgi:hypothetical protein